jgi:diguanylate cyclase (GGDEF)-like protein/PAS domain S-box-containing protein
MGKKRAKTRSNVPLLSESGFDELTRHFDFNSLLSKLREIGLFIQDLEHKKVYPNQLWRSWGYRDEDMAYGNFINFVHPDDRKNVEDALGELDHSGEAYASVLFRIRTASGDWRWINSTSVAITTGPDGELLRYIGFDYDLTEQMEARREAERLAREAETLASAAAIINTELDLQHTIDAILEQAELVIPYSSASVQLLKGDHLELVGGRGFKNIHDILGENFPIPGDNPNTRVVQDREPMILDDELRERYPRFLEIASPDIMAWMGVPLISREEIIGMMTFDRNSKPGFTKRELKLAQGFANHVAIALQNARHYEEMRSLSTRDALTGCFNRRWMYEAIEQQMELSIRHGQELSLIMYDLDDFKMLNDSYGHLFGDRVLKTVTEITRKALRKTDSLCRYGGEEFVIILPQTSESDAFETAERIRIAMEEHSWFPDSEDGVTLSIGCASMQISDLKHQESFLTRVDSALLHSKKTGKNRSTRYSAMR